MTTNSINKFSIGNRVKHATGATGAIHTIDRNQDELLVTRDDGTGVMWMWGNCSLIYDQPQPVKPILSETTDWCAYPLDARATEVTDHKARGDSGYDFWHVAHAEGGTDWYANKYGNYSEYPACDCPEPVTVVAEKTTISASNGGQWWPWIRCTYSNSIAAQTRAMLAEGGAK